MEIQFHLAEADYASASRTYLKHNPWTFFLAFRYPIGIAVAAIAISVQHPDALQSAGWVLAIGIGLGAYFWAVYRRNWYRRFRGRPVGHRLISATIDGDSISFRGQTQEVAGRWDKFRDIFESNRFFVFEGTNRRVLFIPKAALTELQLQELRGVISANAKCKVRLMTHSVRATS